MRVILAVLLALFASECLGQWSGTVNKWAMLNPSLLKELYFGRGRKEMIKATAPTLIKSCNSEFNLFQWNPAKSGTIPATLVLGQTVIANIEGQFSEDVTVSNVATKISWGGSLLYSEDTLKVQNVDNSESFKSEMSWEAPQWSPLGHYSIKMLIEGTTKDKKKDGTIGCVIAEFTFSN